MADYDNNEELASLMRWWSKNGTAAIVGVLIGVLVIGGWYVWGWYGNRQDAQAADMYAKVQHGIATDNVTSGVDNLVDKLENSYSGTAYAGAAALAMAGYYVQQDKLDKAAAELDWAMNNADGKGLRQIATVRKARVLWAQNKSDAALKLLDQAHPASFDSLYAEVAGDIHAARGDRAAARAAYEKALAKLPPEASRPMLQQKLDQTTPAQAANAMTTDSEKSDS
ncbi:YfgM family protein [Salinisphaera sp.]|uniref:YfgM family protein n=1 Tax=Salinisphaera sp. TaxID=1914330 RepID=UPI002D7A28F9|nr:tetratricopeptide repeat protein [Salinisphaera sp.]HET7314674.1 tetratricopeptide repeat protein [Salinisphaera sp.]